jgi:alkylation response protein AidB-like acyl-CoA dehydrogenase
MLEQPLSHLSTALAAAGRVAALARRRASVLDRDGAFPEQEIAALAGEGLLAASLPVRLGGIGLGRDTDGAAMLARVLMRLGAGSLPLGRLFEGHVNAIGLVLEYGDSAQQRRAAADARAGCLFGV